MKRNKLLRFEILLSFVMFGIGLLMDLSPILSGGQIWSKMLSGANNSAWESFKPFMLSFVMISVLEMGGVRLPVARFVYVHVTTLYVYTFLGLFATMLYNGSTPYNVMYYAIVLMIGFICRVFSVRMMFSEKNRDFMFIPMLIALVLYILIVLFFTPYPPHTALFYDFELGKYGF